jgi:integrase/recombinase XerC
MNNLEAFIDYLKLEKQFSTHTVVAYRRDIESFLDSLTTDRLDNLSKVDYQDIRNWLVTLVDSGVTNRTINRKISSLNSFFKFLMKVEVCWVNPLSKHKALKTKKSVQIPFSKTEMVDVFEKLSETQDFTTARDRLIVELFYSTGMRRIELVNLKLTDINWSNNTIKVLGKRNKERLLPMIPPLINSLKNYLRFRTENPGAREEYLFLTERGTKIYEMLVYRIINKYFSEVSSKLKCSPHVLRHSFATHLLNEGADINSVKELLGHSSLAATQIYTHNSISELKKTYNRSHPRNQ